MINSQHVTLNDMKQSPQLGVAIGTENGLAEKGLDQMTVAG